MSMTKADWLYTNLIDKYMNPAGEVDYKSLLDEYHNSHDKLETQLAESKKQVQELVQALEFCVNAAINLYRPDKPVHKGLDPTFYHTLTFEGDLELIDKTNFSIGVLSKHKLKGTK